jgi:hypothetical protein
LRLLLKVLTWWNVLKKNFLLNFLFFYQIKILNKIKSGNFKFFFFSLNSPLFIKNMYKSTKKLWNKISSIDLASFQIDIANCNFHLSFTACKIISNKSKLFQLDRVSFSSAQFRWRLTCGKMEWALMNIRNQNLCLKTE